MYIKYCLYSKHVCYLGEENNTYTSDTESKSHCDIYMWVAPSGPALSWEKEKAFLDRVSERLPGKSGLVAILGKRLALVVQSCGSAVWADRPGRMQPWGSLDYVAKG